MNNKQTAVEWLRKEIILNSKNKENSKGIISFEIGLSKLDELFIQSNEMGRQQIIDAYHRGYANAISIPNKEYNPEQYYNKTFNK